ncbi:hypothetical protein RFI_25527 [Reticulomyxa filosa]|uniref:Uncharacterized protein n=1 Tax=Reticulomyxa filosa TaxID=46433 RepID=X6MD84_RETFI|nr:hypothetical protein RFI_25527 [Reticulomyxa filosa]|eukprot:ETO11849.1 hypothetical protein RFI_25527 [Reticulomyxa filosa]
MDKDIAKLKKDVPSKGTTGIAQDKSKPEEKTSNRVVKRSLQDSDKSRIDESAIFSKDNKQAINAAAAKNVKPNTDANASAKTNIDANAKTSTNVAANTKANASASANAANVDASKTAAKVEKQESKQNDSWNASGSDEGKEWGFQSSQKSGLDDDFTNNSFWQPGAKKTQQESNKDWKEEYKSRIIDIYKKHAPERLANIDELILKYGANPTTIHEKLYLTICSKYKEQPKPMYRNTAQNTQQIPSSSNSFDDTSSWNNHGNDNDAWDSNKNVWGNDRGNGRGNNSGNNFGRDNNASKPPDNWFDQPSNNSKGDNGFGFGGGWGSGSDKNMNDTDTNLWDTSNNNGSNNPWGGFASSDTNNWNSSEGGNNLGFASSAEQPAWANNMAAVMTQQPSNNDNDGFAAFSKAGGFDGFLQGGGRKEKKYYEIDCSIVCFIPFILSHKD